MGQYWIKPNKFEHIDDRSIVDSVDDDKLVLNKEIIDEFYSISNDDLNENICLSAFFAAHQIKKSSDQYIQSRYYMEKVLNRIPIQFKTKTICDVYLINGPILNVLHPDYHTIENFVVIHFKNLQFDNWQIQMEHVKTDLKKFSKDNNTDIINIQTLNIIIDNYRKTLTYMLSTTSNCIKVKQEYKTQIIDTLSVIPENMLTIDMKALITQI